MIHPIVKFGNPVLEKPSETITSFDDDLKKLVAVLIQADRFGTGVALSLRQLRRSPPKNRDRHKPGPRSVRRPGDRFAPRCE